MSAERRPVDIITDLAASFRAASDSEVLDAIAALPPLLDESDSHWEHDEYWHNVAYLYVALADVAAERRLRGAIRPLLDRACYGDPGEIMRGLRHSLEAIVQPDWDALADICLDAARCDRLGTKLWAIDELAVLDDPRARPIFEEAVANAPKEIRELAEIGLKRLPTAG